ncbi:hypothetical protein [Sulfurimonas sp.]|uniref:hypothetical protein n=1 Tax=Sulfurimonas sp. TaxID=2022749 RepID=UPI002B485A35|nr:hypothetical protein [Sulfurimonas sp.]
MKKILLILISIFMLSFASDIPTRTGTFPDKEMKSQNKKITNLVAEEISSTLPQIVDKYTTLISVKANNLTLVYTFKIKTGSKSDEVIKKEDHSRMKKAIILGVCQSSSKFLVVGINTSYIYISAKTSAQLFKFDISQKDCVKSKN